MKKRLRGEPLHQALTRQDKRLGASRSTPMPRLSAVAVAAACLLACSPLRARTWHVDYSAGSDDAAGSAAAPFRHCPGDSRASGSAASALLAPGDRVIFKGGVTYRGSIACPADGVTYDGNSAGTFGAGRAVISGEGAARLARGFDATHRSGLRFEDLEICSYGGHGAVPWTGRERRGMYGYGLYLDACSDIRVERCLFCDIGDWRNEPGANEGCMEGVGIEIIDSASAVTIDGCDFTRIGRAGILVDPRLGSRNCAGIAIERNDFHDYLRWGICLTTGNTGCTLQGVSIVGNRFHDVYQYRTDGWRGLRGDAPHVDSIIAYIGYMPPAAGQTLGTSARPILIADNSFYNDASAPFVQNAAVFLNTWGGRVVICNNTFVNTLFDGNGAIFCLEGTDVSANPPPDYWIANNSFYDTTYAVTLESARYPLRNGSVRILNNIFCKPDSGAGYSVRVMDAASTPAELDRDVYFTNRPDDRVALAGGFHVSLDGLRDQGFEIHGVERDPRFRRAAALGDTSSRNDLRLQRASPARGEGANLSALFATDKDGSPRPKTGAWDAGAFAFSAAAR